MGLVDRVVEPGQAVAAAIERAEQIAAFPFEYVLADRVSTYVGLDLPLEEAMPIKGAAELLIVAREGADGLPVL